MYRLYIGQLDRFSPYLYVDLTVGLNRGHTMSQDNNDAEIRLMGLILSQSALIGVAVAIFDSKLWLVNDDVWMNGLNYGMGAFAVQGLAYYMFKMFFERNLQERARINEMQRTQQSRFRNMQVTFDQRRSEMELRKAEAELEKELRWMEQNPGKVPSGFSPTGSARDGLNLGSDMHSTFNPGTPVHEASITPSLNLGANESSTRLKKDGTPDLRYKKARGDE